MGYNLDLEYRIDRLLPRLGRISKKKMFGGVGYLLNGNLCFGIHKESLILRVTPEKADSLMKNPEIKVFDITGRPMKGWVLVSPDLVESEDKLADMLELGVSFAKNLPAKYYKGRAAPSRSQRVRSM
jgi:TfoX/Sxy family transcriptional regulator of competence genes